MLINGLLINLCQNSKSKYILIIALILILIFIFIFIVCSPFLSIIILLFFQSNKSVLEKMREDNFNFNHNNFNKNFNCTEDSNDDVDDREQEQKADKHQQQQQYNDERELQKSKKTRRSTRIKKNQQFQKIIKKYSNTQKYSNDSDQDSDEQHQSEYHHYKNRNCSGQGSQNEEISNEYSSKMTQSQKQLDKYIKNKYCEICHQNNPQDQDHTFLCDRCDDAYHDYCVHERLQQGEDQKWICPPCREDLQKVENIKLKMPMQEDAEQFECFLCHQPLDIVQTISALRHDKVVQIQIEEFVPQKCLYCKHTFHYSCFNPRCQALNCKTCQKKIRIEGPRCHQEFIQYITTTKLQFKNRNYKSLKPIKYQKQYERSKLYNLKLPGALSCWQFIASYEASLYYAFRTKNLNFVQDQIYDNDLTMGLNCHEGDQTFRALDQKDEKVFQKFKENTRNGIAGPFQIRQNRIKGFYIVATDFLQKNSIICEYVGQVMDSRRALKQQTNDSIFMLIKHTSSNKSLDIVPNQFCNISRFLLGINNSHKSYLQLQNVKAIRFLYKGRGRILFYCKRDIQAGESLYFNYNGTSFKEYPTDHFT